MIQAEPGKPTTASPLNPALWTHKNIDVCGLQGHKGTSGKGGKSLGAPKVSVGQQERGSALPHRAGLQKAAAREEKTCEKPQGDVRWWQGVEGIPARWSQPQQQQEQGAEQEGASPLCNWERKEGTGFTGFLLLHAGCLLSCAVFTFIYIRKVCSELLLAVLTSQSLPEHVGERFLFKAFESSDSCEMHSFSLGEIAPCDAVNPAREITTAQAGSFPSRIFREGQAREMRACFLRKREV